MKRLSKNENSENSLPLTAFKISLHVCRTTFIKHLNIHVCASQRDVGKFITVESRKFEFLETGGFISKYQKFILLGGRHNKFSFLKEGLPSLATACAPCGNTSEFGYFYTALQPRHRRTSTIVIESVGKILFWQKKNTNSYLKRHLAPYTEGL